MGKRSLRLNQLTTILKNNDDMSVNKLAEMLNVSEMTVRRDLLALEENNIINRSYGKITYIPTSMNENNSYNYELNLEKNIMNDEKELIAKYAASLISPSDVIIIDTGSTTDRLVKYIREDLGITAICYNFNVLAQLVNKPGIKLIFPGGYYHQRDQMFESPEGISLIENIRATKLFISASGIHAKLGLTCAHNYEVPTKRTVLQSSQTKILLADSSKFGKIRPAYFAQLDEVDVIITDSKLNTEWREIINNLNITLHVVDL